jgi:hypothetical protein
LAESGSIHKHHLIASDSFCLGGTILEEVECYTYLGVVVKNSLKLSDHIAGICSRTKRILGMSCGQFYNNSSPESLKQLYVVLVLTHLEYSCQLWDPYTHQDINRESVQKTKSALKLISRLWDAGYKEVVSLVNVPKLSNKWLQLKFAQVYEIIHQFP